MKNNIRSYQFDQESLHQEYKISKSEVIDFKPDKYVSGHYILRLKMDQLKGDNFKLTLNKDHLTVIQFESIDFDRPIYSHHIRLNELGDHPINDVVNLFDFKLPDESYFLISYETVPLSNILKVTLGKMNFN